MDSNSRFTSWHDTLPNARGRSLEEFLMSQRLHVMNEESDYTTFRSGRGTSNIDLTVISNQLLRAVVEWEISDQDAIGQDKGNRIEFDFQDVRYTSIVQKLT